jgi:hypothetical protein
MQKIDIARISNYFESKQAYFMFQTLKAINFRIMLSKPTESEFVVYVTDCKQNKFVFTFSRDNIPMITKLATLHTESINLKNIQSKARLSKPAKELMLNTMLNTIYKALQDFTQDLIDGKEPCFQNIKQQPLEDEFFEVLQESVELLQAC